MSILGLEDAADHYSRFDLERWRNAVEKQRNESGLPEALRRLTTDLVTRAKQRTLELEGTQFYKQVRKINRSQQ